MPNRNVELPIADGFHSVYFLELFARQPFAFDDAGFRRKLEASFGSVTANSSEKMYHYFLNGIPVPFKEGNGAAQVLVSWHEPTGRSGWNLVDSIRQSRRLPEVAERLAGCPHRAIMNDFMSSPLDHRTRRRNLATALHAVVENSNVDLVHFVPTQEFLDAREASKQLSTPEQLPNPIYGFLNVRFFTITDSDGAMVMDTLGLSAVGLTDIQIHYRQLDPGAVAGLMYSLGTYLFERGDIIDAGQTVQGIPPESKWRCQREISLLEPKRLVIDINPGPALAAGNRGPR